MKPTEAEIKAIKSLDSLPSDQFMRNMRYILEVMQADARGEIEWKPFPGSCITVTGTVVKESDG
jgi:hypothetical protein